MKAVKSLFQEVWQGSRSTLLGIVALNLATSLTGGIGIVMLVPMLDMLNIESGTSARFLGLAASAGVSPGALPVVLLGLYIVLIALKAVLGRVRAIREGAFIQSYNLKLRSNLYRAVAGAKWERLSSYRKTDIINLFTEQCGKVSYVVSEIIHMLSALISSAIQLVVACVMSLPVTAFVFVAGMLLLVIFRPMLSRARAFGKELIKLGRGFHAELLNQLSGIKEARTYGVEAENAARFESISADFQKEHLRYLRIATIPQIVYAIAAALIIAGVYLICMFLLKLPPARLIILVYIFARLWPVFSSLQGRLQGIQSNLPAYHALEEAIAGMKADAAENPGGGEGAAFSGSLSLRDVAFSYQGSDKRVLQNISFTLNAGTITALVGRSGAGKSTIADILLGLLEPNEGAIYLGDTAIAAGEQHILRRQVGYMPQEPLILNASVRENLLWFHPGAREEEMVSSLKRAHAWSFVKDLPQGLDTPLGDQGVRLSGGERQRIVLARVLLGDPKLIILDEATSALDHESERAIHDLLKSIKKDTAILIIAHRLATVLAADNALVLENGVIAESGELSSLLKQKESYLSQMVSWGEESYW